MEEDDSITGSDVVLYGPAYSVRALVGEVNGDADFTTGAGGGSWCCGGLVARGGGVVDSDLGELWVGFVCGVIGVLHFFGFLDKKRKKEGFSKEREICFLLAKK